MHPECLNLSNLEDGSCLVCNALIVGRKYEIASFRNANREISCGNQLINKSKGLIDELNKLTKIGWYWGKLSRIEAEVKLINQDPGNLNEYSLEILIILNKIIVFLQIGTFFIRDSFDQNYILSLSFKIEEGVFHTRIEFRAGHFHFYLHPNKTYETVSNLVDDLILNSQTGIYYYIKSKKTSKEIRFTIKLDKPLSRFNKIKSLKYLCRFAIKQNIRYDLIQELPLPVEIKSYLEENHF